MENVVAANVRGGKRRLSAIQFPKYTSPVLELDTTVRALNSLKTLLVQFTIRYLVPNPILQNDAL